MVKREDAGSHEHGFETNETQHIPPEIVESLETAAREYKESTATLAASSQLLAESEDETQQEAQVLERIASKMNILDEMRELDELRRRRADRIRKSLEAGS